MPPEITALPIYARRLPARNGGLFQCRDDFFHVYIFAVIDCLDAMMRRGEKVPLFPLPTIADSFKILFQSFTLVLPPLPR